MTPLPRRKRTCGPIQWSFYVPLAVLAAVPLLYFSPVPRLQIHSKNVAVELMQDEEIKQQSESTKCQLTPRFVPVEAVDAPEPRGEVPEHVREFDRKGYKLPKYPSSEVMLVSVASNSTYDRRIAQENTIGRIFHIEYVNPSDLPLCVVCEQVDQDDDCHCPPFRTPCYKQIFFDKSDGWRCAGRREVFSFKVAIDRYKGEELPKWVHFMEDQTFVNPIGLMLLLNELDPEVPYWIGDDWGDFGGGGCGKLASRGLLKLLLQPPVIPAVTRRWSSGTVIMSPETQMDSCLERYQAGDWCYYHGDWAASACVWEVGVNITDLGLGGHLGFFTQLMEARLNSSTQRWFGVNHPAAAKALHRTHSLALHMSIEDMYDFFYNTIVPYYQQFYQSS